MTHFFPESPSNAPPQQAPERVVITAMGTVTPQGCSTWSSALALRFRKTAWCEHETVLLPADPHGIVLRGATVSRLPETLLPPDLDGAERAAALLSPALNDCLAGLSPQQIHSLECRIDNFIDQDREDFHRLLREGFPLLPLTAEQRKAGPPSALGHACFFERIMTAAEELREGTQDRILVGCVDSLCATSWLMKVRDDGILKDCLTPEGIIAGEAAGAVLLERESKARERQAPVLSVISSWGRGMESNSWQGPIPATGRGLTEAFCDAFSSLDDGGRSIATVVADLNGERHRALDWAYTEGRIFPDSEQEPELRHPAFITGDCGGATGAVLLADAVGRSAFHPRFGGRVALASSDESGARRVIVLEPGDRPDPSVLMEQIRTRLQGKRPGR